MFRKPEIYKYARAKKLDYTLVIEKKMSDIEYNQNQQKLNLKAMNERTSEEIKGQIRQPSLRERISFSYEEWFGTLQEKQYMTKVDLYCMEQAKKRVDVEMLDIGHILT